MIFPRFGGHPERREDTRGVEAFRAVSLFKGDFFQPPKVWSDQTYSQLFYWNEVPKGGHFAGLEQPELFVAEVRKSFAQMR